MLESINYYHNNPEKICWNDNNEFKESRLTVDEEFVYKKLTKEVLEIIPSMDDFSDVHSGFEIKKDKCKLESVSKDFSKKTMRSELAESILGTQIEEANWFGQDCEVTYCNKYDDTLNHTDMVLAFPSEGEKPVLIGVDVTTTDAKPEIEGKVDRILREIEKEKLGKLKYYDSLEYPELKGSNKFVPRVIIKFSESEVERLSSIMKNVLLRKEGSNKLMADDEVQLQILEEARAQLEIELYHAVYSFLDKAEKALDQGNLDKEVAIAAYEIWQNWKKRDISRLLKAVDKNRDFIMQFDNFDFRIVDKIMDAYFIVNNIGKEKRSLLDKEINFNQDVKAPMDKIKQDREKDLTFSHPWFYH